MQADVIIQARVSSTRLPGKTLEPILDRPMLLRQIERVKRAQQISRCMVATSTDPSDDAIEALCRKENILYFRGSLPDVLDRFYKAARSMDAAHLIRLTADCPLIDPELIDRMILFYTAAGFDYVTNRTPECGFPDGLDTEIFSFSKLERVWHAAKLSSEREHVTPYFYTHPEQFKIGYFKNEKDLSALRWTVDENKDMELVKNIYGALYPSKPAFTTEDILDYLNQHAWLKTHNTSYQRDAGYFKSLKKDRER